MSSDNNLKINYVIQYQELLELIENLDKISPDNSAGHNILVEYARKILQRAEVVGVTELDPLPPLR
jgi:hypothetical protein